VCVCVCVFVYVCVCVCVCLLTACNLSCYAVESNTVILKLKI